jgi:hypothetical protein
LEQEWLLAVSVTQVGLVFDDGLKDSVYPLVACFERHGLRADLAIIAEPDAGPLAGQALGWEVWRTLSARGHRIHPHGLDHQNEATQPLAIAQERIERCLERFAHELPGFVASDAVFHYPYNSTTPELDAWLRTQVRATRAGGTGLMSAAEVASGAWHCTCFGPGPADEHLHAMLDQAIAVGAHTLLFMAHGLDGEGWGPLGLSALDSALERIVRDPRLRAWDLATQATVNPRAGISRQ